MVVNLPPDLAEYVTQQVAAGKYASEEELLCAAIRRLQERHERLKELIAEGMADPENDLILKDDAALAKYFQELAEELTPVAHP